MAFTYSVTGTSPNQVLSITSPTSVNIDLSNGNIVLSQTGSATQEVGALSGFSAGGVPVQTMWNGVPTANVVLLSGALSSADFLNLFGTGEILAANASGATWSVLSQALDNFADGAIANLSLSATEFASFNASLSNVAALDPVLSNVAGEIATVTAAAAASGATINASNYDFASFKLVGTTNSDTITGGAGNDIIGVVAGDTGNDVISAGAGNDTIQGGSGNDVITGGSGADRITVDLGTDTINDLGNGADVLIVSSGALATATVTTDWVATSSTSNNGVARVDLTLANGVDVDLRAAAGSAGYTIGAASNTAGSVVVGSTLNDVITGSSLADELRGAVGNDTINGGAGNDVIYGGAGNNSLVGGAGADAFYVTGTDTVADLGVGADVLSVSGAYASATATVQSDWTATSATQHSGLGTVSLSLQNGVDVDLRAATGDHGYTIAAGASNTAASSVTGSNFADIISGTSVNDVLRGALGNDSINGGSGNDVIYGGGGADTLLGGYGNDVVYGGDGDDNIQGAQGANTLYGDAGADTFTVTGTDTIADLGVGSDVLVVGTGAVANAWVVSDWTATSATHNDAAGAVTLGLLNGVDINLSAAATTEGFTITAAGNALGSTVVGSTVADVITGGSGNDELRGNKGDDTINGGVGDDIIYGGAGTNSLVGGAGADTFNITGTDTVADLGAGADALVVSGAAVVSATVVSDWVATAATANTSTGTVTIDLNSGVDANLRAAMGDAGYTITAVNNTAASVVIGSNFDDVILGSSLNDELRGAQGDDSILGGVGNDVLYGGAGADTFNVQDGNDTIRDLGMGDDILIVGGSDTVVANVVSDWTATSDTTIVGGTASLFLSNGVDIDLGDALATDTAGYFVSATGNINGSTVIASTADDVILGGNGNDELRGRAGVDDIDGAGGDDIISGGADNDILSGGAGSDLFLYTTGSTDFSDFNDLEMIVDFNGLQDLISTGIAGLTSAEVSVVDGTTIASSSAFTTAAAAAFAAGKEVFVAYNYNATGDALVAINNDGYSGLATGDNVIQLVGINQASEISASNFIA